MSLVKVALEAQEQDLEYQAGIDQEQYDDDADNIAESPFSPVASRAFTTAVDDSDSLGRMNDVLEDVEVDDIPESSRLVMETAMEAIRSRLVGTPVKAVPALEGFKNGRNLKVAIEENKNLLSRVWDAIVKFFKGIYEWVTGFFKKKQDETKVVEQKIEKVKVVSKVLATYSPEEAKKADDEFMKKLEELGETVKSLGMEAKLKDGTLISAIKNSSETGNVAKEDGDVDYNKLAMALKGILLGTEPIILVTDKYNQLLGSSNVSIKSNWTSELEKLSSNIHSSLSSLDKTGLEDFASKPVNKDTLAGVTSKTLEEIMGKDVPLSLGSGIAISGNNVSIKKFENNQIEIEMTGGPSLSNKIAEALRGNLKELAQATKECNEFAASTTNKVFDFGKTLDADSTESEETVKLLKSKMQLINGVIKFIVLAINHGNQLTKLSVDLVESYVAAIKMIVEQAKKAQSAS